ncbi:hypothetical protein KM043_011614 [Ampulex compressa]|nr:hypothetical protein KM043_011614 [Ampulex compressa]
MGGKVRRDTSQEDQRYRILRQAPRSGTIQGRFDEPEEKSLPEEPSIPKTPYPCRLSSTSKILQESRSQARHHQRHHHQRARCRRTRWPVEERQRDEERTTGSEKVGGRKGCAPKHIQLAPMALWRPL